MRLIVVAEVVVVVAEVVDAEHRWWDMLGLQEPRAIAQLRVKRS